MIKKKSTLSPLRFIILILIACFIVWFFLKREASSTKDANILINQTQAAITATPLATVAVDQELPSGREVPVSILMYHHVGPLPENADDIRKGLTVSAVTFENQMKKLKDDGYNVLTLSEMYGRIASGVPPKTVILTFDDGYEDNFSSASPILQKFGFRATFFIITSRVGSGEYMNEDQIKELARAGNEVASHSAHHLSLDTVKGATLEGEIKDAKIYLDKLLNQNTISFCYPAGKFSDEAKSYLKKDGYKIAVTTEASKGVFNTDNMFQVARYRVNAGSSLSFLPKN